ncbi:DMT family transporter [Actinocatenispora rupis]|nr:DMT family transporter [Actinocatenispora rupis]
MRGWVAAFGTVGRLSPRWAMAVGALGVSSSAVFIELSGTTPGTASVFRCLLALPLLVPLWRAERRRRGPLSRRGHARAVAAGVLFAGDALLWTQAIQEVGAGLSTVLVNAQVVIVPLVARVVDRERVPRSFWPVLPVMVVGIVLTGGVLETGTPGARPAWGTLHALGAALCYSGFLFLLRRGGAGGQVAQSYRDVVASAALVSWAVGAAWQGVTLTPGWVPLGWLALTALCGQVLGWLLVVVAGPRLPSAVGASLLMLTPVGALALSALALAETPTVLQLLGCVLVLGAAYAMAADVLGRRSAERRNVRLRSRTGAGRRR